MPKFQIREVERVKWWSRKGNSGQLEKEGLKFIQKKRRQKIEGRNLLDQ